MLTKLLHDHHPWWGMRKYQPRWHWGRVGSFTKNWHNEVEHSIILPMPLCELARQYRGWILSIWRAARQDIIAEATNAGRQRGNSPVMQHVGQRHDPHFAGDGHGWRTRYLGAAYSSKLQERTFSGRSRITLVTALLLIILRIKSLADGFKTQCEECILNGTGDCMNCIITTCAHCTSIAN